MPNAAPATRNAGRPAGGNLRFPRRRRATLRPNAKSRLEAFNNPTNPQSAQAAPMRNAAPAPHNGRRPAGGNLRFPRRRRATPRPYAKSRPEAFNNPTNPQSAQAAPMRKAAPATRNAGRPAGGNLRFQRRRRATPLKGVRFAVDAVRGDNHGRGRRHNRVLSLPCQTPFRRLPSRYIRRPDRRRAADQKSRTGRPIRP